MTVIDNNIYYHLITFHKPHFQRNKNQHCRQPLPHLLAQHPHLLPCATASPQLYHWLIVLIFSHFNGGQYLCNSLRGVRKFSVLSGSPHSSKRQHHRAPHTSAQPPRIPPVLWGSTYTLLDGLQNFPFLSLFPNVLGLTGVSLVSWLLGQLLGCTPQACKAYTCPDSRPKKQPRVSDRAINGLMDERGLYVQSKVLEQLPTTCSRRQAARAGRLSCSQDRE